MLEMLKSWLDKYLPNEEALLFAVLLVGSFVVILTVGDLLAPLLTSVVFAFLMQGLINFQMEHRVPGRIAMPVTYLLFLGAFFGVIFLVIPLVWRQLTSLFSNLPEMYERAQAAIDLLPESYPNLITNVQLSAFLERLAEDMPQAGQWLLSYSLSQLPLVITVLLYMVLVPILVFFFLKDKDEILSWVLDFLPAKRPLMDKVGEEMSQQMANYVRGKVIEIIITGGATYVVFVIYDLNYAALLAFLVGLSVIVPYVGIAVVTVPVALIGYIQFGLTSEFVYVMLLYGIIQALDGLVLVPILFSEAVNLHPVAIIAALLVFGGLWGLWGVFFAIPLATLVKSVMNSWPRQITPEASGSP